MDPFLWIGVTRAVFQDFGKVPRLVIFWNNLVIGFDNELAQCFSPRGLMLSNPTDLLSFSFFKTLLTLFSFTLNDFSTDVTSSSGRSGSSADSSLGVQNFLVKNEASVCVGGN